jgi:SOS-response transcriptional repressor LexA
MDGCANLKKFERDTKTGDVMLVSESKNSKHKPIYVSSEDDFMINGKIVNVIKK